MNSNNKKEKGFTIIEVVLVLAIAGLIFLVVFLALPALQRSQRDQQRRSDLGRVASALQTYQSNNNGKVPSTTTELTTFTNNYLKVTGDTFADPNGTDYTVELGTAQQLAQVVPANTIRYFYQARCDGENAVAATGTRQVAVRIDLETGGSFCQQN